MTVREMHIRLEQKVGQMASNKTRKLMPEEKDLHLRIAEARFIRLQLKPKQDSGGFELDQMGVDNIRTLIVSGVSLKAYIEDSSRYKVHLPFDYMYLLSNWSYSLPLCGTPAIVKPATIYLDALRQDITTKTTAPFYQTLSVAVKDTVIKVPDTLPYGHAYQGYPERQDIQWLSPLICTLGQLYWEKAGGFNYPGHYIRLSETPGNGPNLLVTDGVNSNTQVHKEIKTSVHDGPGVFNDNRLTASNKISGLSRVAFYKTAYYSPISEIENNILYIYRDDSFIVTGAGVSYVRKPQPISLSLNTDSELPETAHDAIVDLATESIKGIWENPQGQKLATQEIESRVIL